MRMPRFGRNSLPVSCPRFDDMMMIIIDLIKRVSDLEITVDGKVIYIDK